MIRKNPVRACRIFTFFNHPQQDWIFNSYHIFITLNNCFLKFCLLEHTPHLNHYVKENYFTERGNTVVF